MIIGALLLFTMQPPPQIPSRPAPTAEVIISERLVYLPHMPETAAKAHREFGSLRTNLSEGLKDLERTLQGLYATPEARVPLPPSLKISKNKAEEMRFLAALLRGERYRTLEEPFSQAWDEWQTALVQSGLAQPVEADAQLPSSNQQEKKESQEIQRRIRGMQKSESAKNNELMFLIEIFKNSPGAGEQIESVQQIRADQDDQITTAVAMNWVANHHAPSLSKTWAPLAELLNADALHLANLEGLVSEPGDVDFRTLQVQARIHFLERFRAALWIASAVWARMTSTPPPDPLKELNPYKFAVLSPKSPAVSAQSSAH